MTKKLTTVSGTGPAKRSRRPILAAIALATLMVGPSAMAQQRSDSWFSGILGVFSSNVSAAGQEAILADDHEIPKVELPIAGNEPLATSDETTLRVEHEDVTGALEGAVDLELALADVITAQKSAAPTDQRSFGQRLKSKLTFSRRVKPEEAGEPEIELPLLPEDTTLTAHLAQMDAGMIKKFFEIQQGGLRKIALAARRANIPQNEITALLAHSNVFLFKSAKQLVSGAAWSWGFDLQIFGGPAAGRLGQTVILGMLGKKFRATKVADSLRYLMTKGNGFFFQGSGGFNVLYTTDANGRKRTFLQFTAAADKTNSVMTVTSGLGYDARLVLSTYSKTAIDPVTGQVQSIDPETGKNKWVKNMKTTTLGMAGAMSTGEGVTTMSIPVPIPFIGGASIIPFVGSVAIYESSGVRVSVMTLEMTKLTNGLAARTVASAFRMTRKMVGAVTGYGAAVRCEGTLLN